MSIEAVRLLPAAAILWVSSFFDYMHTDYAQDLSVKRQYDNFSNNVFSFHHLDYQESY